MPTPTALEIRLFGPFAALVGGSPLPHLHSRKGQWILALLALRAPRPVDRSWLAGTLWPESTEGDALHNLRQSLADLRRALGPEAHRLVAPTSRTLRLDLDGTAVDLIEFDAAVARADLRSLEAIVSVGARPLLEGCGEEWVAEERLPREQAYLMALETLAGAAAKQKEYAAAISYLRRAVERDPYREEAHRALMRALLACGAASAAVQVYRDLRQRLRREMNTEPDAETTALFRRLRQEAVSASAIPAAPAPERVKPSAPPCALSALVGRDAAVQEVQSCLASSRLVTLTGSGGVGKTRLALHAAEVWADVYPDGVWFADLAPLEAAERVIPAIHAAVGLAAQDEDGSPEALRRFLSLRQGLLVLDNCEHLITACAALVSTLLTGCPNLRVLVTSREPFSVGGETIWRVPSLTEEAAVRLFTERAAAAGAAPAEADSDAVVQICRRLDGVPLALELAAARAGILSPVQIAARLDKRFRLLTSGPRMVLPRQQTLRSAIDWSYDLLSPSEQTLFRRLSIFSGGWTLDSAEAVCAGGPVGVEDMTDLLAALARKSLFVSDRQGENVRHRYLETIRQYAREKLEESGESPQVASHYVTYFLHFAEELSGNSRLSAQHWIDAWNSEHDNLRAALRRLLADPDAGEMLLRLVAALDDFWHTEGHWNEARASFTDVLAHPGSQEKTKWRARVLKAAGDTARVQGDNARAQEMLEESRAIWNILEDQEGIAIAVGALGQTARMRGDYAAARAYHEESLQLFRAAHLPYGIINALFNLSSIASMEGDLDQAQAICEECLALARVSGDRHTMALCLYNLGRIAALQQVPARARPLLESSIALQREIGSKHEIPTMLILLADVLRRQGEFDSARVCLRESLQSAYAMGDRRVIASAMSGAAELAQKQQQWCRAACLLSAATALMSDIGASLIVPDTHERTEREQQELRSALGEAAFEAAWLEGRTMTVDQAVTRTLAALSAT